MPQIFRYEGIKIQVTQNTKFVFQRVENTVGKGEMPVFWNAFKVIFFSLGSLKVVIKARKKKNNCVSGHPTDPRKWPPTEKLSNWFQIILVNDRHSKEFLCYILVLNVTFGQGHRRNMLDFVYLFAYKKPRVKFSCRSTKQEQKR